jgi:hydroxymethylpyrimidine/phosphomethylpyrimidine kinase
MVAQSGASLLEADAAATLARRLAPLATVLTPNAPEAATLLGREIADSAAMVAAANDLLELGPGAVLLKGGHLGGATVTDVLATRDGHESFVSPRIETTSNHGTGCTLASALAHRDHQQPRHRLHPGLGARHRPGPGPGAGSRGRPRPRLSARGAAFRARPRPRPRPGQPRPHRPPLRRRWVRREARRR